MDRIALAVIVNAAFAVAGVRAGALDRSGALAGTLCGTVAWGAFGPPGFVLIGVFAVTGSMVTRLGSREKERLGLAQEHSGRRTWINVLANCAAPTLAAAGHAPSAFVAGIACALGDTVATEIGQLSRGGCYLLPTMRRVAAGTPGGVSIRGTVAGLSAIFAVAIIASQLLATPPLRPAICATVGFFAESVSHRLPLVVRRGNWLPNLIATALAAALAGTA